MDVKTKLSLFDTLVVPIILYGSEVWGAYNIKEVDKLHIKFCKLILGVRPQTSNVAVFGDLEDFRCLYYVNKELSSIGLRY